MKITISRSKWEEVGRLAGWSRTAMRQELLKPFIVVMESLKGRGEYIYAPSGYISNSHIDISFYDGAIGEAYIQVYFNESKEMITVEKYYDNEIMNNEYRDMKLVPLNIESPQESVNAVNGILDQWMGANRTSVSANKSSLLIAQISSGDQLQPTDGVQKAVDVPTKNPLINIRKKKKVKEVKKAKSIKLIRIPKIG